jgi:APA family basic amino acid/polyamine antiporter
LERNPPEARRPLLPSLGDVFRVKPIGAILADAEEPEHRLRRALGPLQLTLFGIGAIVGAGIFATIGTAAAGDAYRPGAGPALSVSFVVTAIVCGFTALCYAELASTVPISGSAYTYAYATLGELVAWIIGWDLIIEYAVGNVGVAISWANYFKTLLKGIHVPALGLHGIDVPDWLSMDYRTAARVPGVYENAPHLFGYPIVINVLAVAIVAAVTVVLVWGVRESARFNAVMVGIKLVVLTFFIVVGCYWIEPANYHPFAPNGWAGISAGAAIVFFAYIGFDAVSTVAEETRDPQRNLPIGIIASLIVCTILYVIVGVVFTGLISYPDLRTKLATEQAEPLTMALQHAMPDSRLAVVIVAFGSVIAHTAVLLVFQLGQPRIFFSMARDGMLPPVFYKVHPRFRTPHVSTILTGVFVGTCAAVASIDEMVDLTNIGTLFAFILVCAGTIVLRLTDPDRPRPFRVPGGWAWTAALYAGLAAGILLLPAATLGAAGKFVVLAVSAVVFAVSHRHIFPVLGILSCLYLIYYLPPTSWLRFAAWLNFGFVIYVGYSAVHSRLTGRHTALAYEHDGHTARVGAALAVIGVALLLVTRALDVWLAAAKQAGSSAGLATLPVLFHAAPWLEVSWFLIVPLAVNAFVLCPIIIRRALRSRRDPGAPRPVGSLAVSGALMVATAAYLWLLAASA